MFSYIRPHIGAIGYKNGNFLFAHLPFSSYIRTSKKRKQKIMQITAKLIEILPLQSGMGRNGEWKKQDIIVETPGQYPKKICVSLWGDKFSNVQLNVNQDYVIDFDVESREFNGRWYTDVKAWKIAAQGSAAPQPPSYDGVPDAPEIAPPANPFGEMDDTSDLPF